MGEKAGDLQQRADEVAAAGGASKRRLILLGGLAAALVVAVVWYMSTPHSAAEQLARAKELADAYRADRDNLSAEQRDERRAAVAAAYEKAFTEFEATDEQTVEACARLADLAAGAGDEKEARRWWTKLMEDHPATDAARQAFGELIRSYATEGRARLAGARAEAVELLNMAADLCRRYVTQYGPTDADAARIAMVRCRILHDDIGEPMADAIKALEEFIAVEPFGHSDLMAEALWRLGQLYEKAGEHKTAADYYKRLVDWLTKKDPDSPELKKAEIAYARNVTKYDPEEGETLWRKLAEKYANDPDLNRQANQEADRLAQKRQAHEASEKAEAARKAAEDYRAGRYGGGGGGGGGVPDTQWGKPVPPVEMLRDFIAQKLNATHYDLRIRLEPAANKIKVAGSIALTNEGDEKTSFLLMLGPLMKLGLFRFDGVDVEPSRPVGKAEVVRIKLAKPWPAGASGTLTFDCQAVVTELKIPKGLAEKAMEEISRADGPPAPFVAYAPPTSPDEDPAGNSAAKPAETPAEKPEQDAEEPFNPGLLSDPRLQLQINKTGYALSGAAWYPVTIFGDLFTAEITVEMVGGQKVLCSGRSAEAPATAEAGVIVTRWVCEKPYFGLYFAYGPFQTQRRRVDGLDVGIHFLPDEAGKAGAYLDEVEKVLRFHVSRFGAFPFEKLDVVQVDLPPILGGVGPAGLMFLHAMVVRAKADVPVNLLAHELSHQWWGNQVPINLLDERYTQWLSEGFATYSDAMYTEHAEGEEAFARHIEKMGRLYLDQAATMREEPINKTFMGQSPLYRPVVYEKGALVLHALRYVLGDETFFKVLREYVKSYSFKLSTVDDFRKLATKVAGRDLDWFFNEWLDQPGCPRFVLSDVLVKADENAKRWTVTVRIRQPDTLSRMPLEVRIVGEDGRRKTVRVQTQLERQERQVTAEVDFAPRRVELDPNHWVLRRVKGAEDVWESR